MTLETGRIGRPFQERAAEEVLQLGPGQLQVVGLDAVDLRQGHHAVADAQQGEDVQVLAGLGHHAVVGRHDEDHRVHAGRAGHHGADEVLVARHVDDAHLGVGDRAGGEAQVDRHAPLFLLLQAVGLAAGERLDQGRLAVVDVPGRAHRDVDLGDGHGVCYSLVAASCRRSDFQFVSPTKAHLATRGMTHAAVYATQKKPNSSGPRKSHGSSTNG